MMKKSGDLVAIGRIAGVHGIRGELSVIPLTDFPERLDPGREVLLETPAGEVRPRRIRACRAHKGRLLILFEGVEDRTAAETLRGGWLRVREEDLAPLPPGRYYQHDLVGLGVVTEEGESLGEVREIMDHGGERIILVVRGPRGEVLIPFVEEMIRRVDPAAHRITVRLPEGLLPG